MIARKLYFELVLLNRICKLSISAFRLLANIFMGKSGTPKEPPETTSKIDGFREVPNLNSLILEREVSLYSLDTVPASKFRHRFLGVDSALIFF